MGKFIPYVRSLACLITIWFLTSSTSMLLAFMEVICGDLTILLQRKSFLVGTKWWDWSGTYLTPLIGTWLKKSQRNLILRHHSVKDICSLLEHLATLRKFVFLHWHIESAESKTQLQRKTWTWFRRNPSALKFYHLI